MFIKKKIYIYTPEYIYPLSSNTHTPVVGTNHSKLYCMSKSVVPKTGLQPSKGLTVYLSCKIVTVLVLMFSHSLIVVYIPGPVYS